MNKDELTMNKQQHIYNLTYLLILLDIQPKIKLSANTYSHHVIQMFVIHKRRYFKNS